VEGAIRLDGDGLSVGCVPRAGFAITAIIDATTGANALWERTGFTPGDFRRALGPSGDPSIESFIDLFVGGWFEMFPTTGYPGTVQGPVGPARSLLHGEAMRLPWEVRHQDATAVEASVDMVRTPFRLTRRVEVAGGELVITERAENLSPTPAPYVWGHHPCFDRATFAGGRFEMDVAAAEIPKPVFDERNNMLVAGSSFTFPMAPAATGGVRDIAAIPEQPDGRHEQASLKVRRGHVRITAPRIGRAFSLTWSEHDLPYVLLWQDYRAEGMAFWGTCDTFAIEPSSAPGRSLDDAVAAGAVRYLEPGEEASVSIRARWSSLE
jgi:galactose mutarotase-like enzyme